MILRPWKEILFRVGVLVVGLVVCFYLLLATLIVSSRTPPEEMVPTTLAWGRLAPFPKSAKGFEISSEGGMFTRGFHASFTAPAADVQRWLRESPGTRDVKPEPNTPETRHYRISPGGGANAAEVTVENGTLVRVYVSWS